VTVMHDGDSEDAELVKLASLSGELVCASP